MKQIYQRYFAVLITIIIFIIDVKTPLGVAVGVLYLVPIYFFVKKSIVQELSHYWFVISCFLLVLLGYYFSPIYGIYWVVIINRLLSIFIIGISYIFFVSFFKSKEKEKEINEELNLVNNTLREIKKRKLMEEKLKLSEEKFRTYVENSADVLTITNEKFEIEYNSPNNSTVFGYDKDENIGVNAVELIHPDDITKFNNSFYDIKKKKDVSFFFQYRFKHKTDGWKWVDSSIKYVDNEKQAPYFIVNSRDISKRKEIENRFTSVVEQAEDHIMITDDDGVIEYVNPVMLNFLGYSQQEIYGAKPGILTSYDRPKSMYKKMWRIIKSGRTYQSEFINKKKNGEIYVAQTIIVPLRNTKNEISHFASIGRNITDKRETEKQMTSLIENEKRRISKELHDGIGQTLTAIKFSIGAIVDSSLQGNKETFESIKQLIDQSTKEIHEVSFDLMPSVLEDYGMEAAVKKLISYLNENTNMEIKFAFDNRIKRLNKDVEIGIYRIIQEGLNNAQKYAKCSIINITLELKKKMVFLSIIDNGVGFDPNNIISNKVKGGQGINNMRHRTKLIEGDFEIKSDKNKGTSIEVVIPLNL